MPRAVIGMSERVAECRLGSGRLTGVIRLGTVVLGAEDVARAVAFWRDALGYQPVQFHDADDGFTILVPPSGEGTRVAVHHSETAPHDRPRVHLDLIVDSGVEQQAEIERLVGLGGTRTAWTYPSDPDFVVMSDTEGNRFCVVDASHG
jgi:catechol 2,3-dioxygenase-like lactoylglutathione lyase family enzyme